MGEYVWTTATVGGKISRVDYDSMIGGDYFDFEDFYCDSAEFSGTMNYGECPASLIEFCKDKGLTLRVHRAGASGVFCSSINFWSPTYNVEDVGSDDDGQPSLTLHELKRELAEGHSLEQIIAEFERLTVPPLEIVEG